MNSSTTAKKDSSNSIQPARADFIKRSMSTEQSDRCYTVLGICRALSQKQGVHSTIVMKSAGFHYIDSDDTVQCDTCKLEISGWTWDMKPFTIHAQRSPRCEFVRSIQFTESIAAPSTITFLSATSKGEILSKRQNMEATRENYSPNILIEVDKLKRIRKRTFSHWPHQTSPTSAQMIEAGFFGCNVGDRVVCLYCNIICQQWTPHMDDPYGIHKTLSPVCPYVVTMLARETLLIQQEGARASEVNMDRRQLQISNEDLSKLVNDRLGLSISQSLLARNFELSIIKRSYEDQLRLKYDDFISDSDLLVAFIILQKQIEYEKKGCIIIPSVAMNEIHEREQAANTVLQTNSSSHTNAEMLSSLESVTDEEQTQGLEATGQETN